MKASEKVELVKEMNVVEMHVSGKSIEEICVSLIENDVLNKGIGFGEIQPLVKNILQAEGYYLPIKERRTKATEHVDSLTSLPETYEDMMDLAGELASRFELTEDYMANKIKGVYLKMNLKAPTKRPPMADWKSRVVEAFKSNPEITEEELTDAIGDAVKNPEYYSNLVHEMISQIISE
jgi:hypothetical protein